MFYQNDYKLSANMYQTKKQALGRILIIAGIIVLLNIISWSLYFRMDFTSDKRYTLSKTTKEIIRKIEEPITVTAYFSKKTDPEIHRLKNEFRDMLVEYSNYSRQQIVYNFIDPGSDEDMEREIQQKGILPLLVNIRKKDQFQQQKIYLGVILQQGQKSEVIPAIQPGTPMEYILTFAIKKLSAIEKPVIAFTSGHGEAARKKLENVMEVISVLYKIEDFHFHDSALIPEHISTIALVHPKDTFKEHHFQQLDAFMERGGNIFLAYHRVITDINTQKAELIHTGLEEWLLQKGIELKANLVYDRNSSMVNVQQQRGNYVFNTPVQFFFLPVITSFSEHPVNRGIQALMMPFSGEIDLSRLDTHVYKADLIARTSEYAGADYYPFTKFDVMREWAQEDFNRSGIPLAVALEERGNAGAKMILVSNGTFALNDEQKRVAGSEDNVSFMASAIDWLSDETGLVNLRTKTAKSRPLDIISDSKRSFLKYANAFGPIFIIVLIALLRWQYQLKKRKKYLQGKI
jgi:gliding-associated putative ABC transporter substrate-binding component GldG